MSERFCFRMSGVRSGEEVPLDVKFAAKTFANAFVASNRVLLLSFTEFETLAERFECFSNRDHWR